MKPEYTRHVTMVDESKEIDLMCFDIKPNSVLESQWYGKCRLITDFKSIALIGEGAYGTIYKVKEIKTGVTFALKNLRTENNSKCLSINSVREISILKSISNDNIISTFGVAVETDLASTYIILEYCSFELTKVLDDEEAYSLLDQSQVKNIMHQLLTGLDYLHKHFVLHRDLTPSNILFNSTGILKISDFGEARMYSADESEEKTPNKVTLWYRAPELLLGSKTYFTSIDMWASGCIFGELLLKRPLFPGDSDTHMIRLIVEMLGTPNEGTCPGLSKLPVMQNYELYLQPFNKLKSHYEVFPSSCISLLQQLFLYDPKKRITAEECLSHSYFTEDKPNACDLDTLLITLRRPDVI